MNLKLKDTERTQKGHRKDTERTQKLTLKDTEINIKGHGHE